MSEAEVLFRVEDAVGWVTFSNPGKRNSLTWSMYDGLSRILDELEGRPELRVLVLRGTPEDGFAAGTDIRQFVDFRSGEQGLEYEKRVGEVIAKLAGVKIPVVALVEGAAVGAGLALAVCCDLVVAERGARFGAPIARTLGNCLPASVVSRLRSRIGAPRADSMLLSAALIPAEELTGSGFVSQLVEPGGLSDAADRLVRRIAQSAPLTLKALKETGRRLDAVPLPDTDDLLRECYGSEDFREGVRAFLEQRRADWKGR
jgi:enoyl-CoA hydratase